MYSILEENPVFILLLVILAIACFALWLILFFIIPFVTELRELNIEISRCTGEELKYYKRRRRKLFLSLLPFVKY